MKNGSEFLETLPDDCESSVCHHCGEDCSAVALVSLVYTWEPCSCEKVDYVHLRPSLWHKECFAKHNKPLDEYAQKAGHPSA